MKNLILKIVAVLILLINTILLFTLGAGWWAYGFNVQAGFITLVLGIIGVVIIFLIKTSD
ncbi:hypothetical protein HY637_01235 [Candidatus Woesearchaeota archaeon]|nr:hypothetical protein [Candidatus Woesearchaeota archaeon]